MDGVLITPATTFVKACATGISIYPMEAKITWTEIKLMALPKNVETATLHASMDVRTQEHVKITPTCATPTAALVTDQVKTNAHLASVMPASVTNMTELDAAHVTTDMSDKQTTANLPAVKTQDAKSASRTSTSTHVSNARPTSSTSTPMTSHSDTVSTVMTTTSTHGPHVAEAKPMVLQLRSAMNMTGITNAAVNGTNATLTDTAPHAVRTVTTVTNISASSVIGATGLTRPIPFVSTGAQQVPSMMTMPRAAPAYRNEETMLSSTLSSNARTLKTTTGI